MNRGSIKSLPIHLQQQLDETSKAAAVHRKTNGSQQLPPDDSGLTDFGSCRPTRHGLRYGFGSYRREACVQAVAK